MYETLNPPWADRALDKYRAILETRLHESGLDPAKLMPDPETISKELVLGCGHYGCVYKLPDPGFVLKLTSDESEAAFVQQAIRLKANQVDPDGLVKYLLVLAVPETHRNRKLFFIWRESASTVGTQEVFRALGGHGEPRFDYRAYKEGETWLHVSHRSSGMFRELARKREPEEMFAWLARQEDLAQNPDIQADLDEISKFQETRKVPLRVRRDHAGAWLYSVFETSLDMLESTNYWYEIGRAMREYLQEGFLMADVHGGNVGLVSRPETHQGEVLVIVDPGHVVPLKPELANVQIPEA